MRNSLSTMLIGMLLLCLAATAADAVQGRAYVEREKQIYKLAKAVDVKAEEVKAFGDLLRELDDCDLEESSRDFWRTARSVKDAMDEQLRQARAQLKKELPVQQAGVSDTASLDMSEDAVETPLSKRVHRMEMILRETEGLRNPMSMNDESVINRYRLLVGEYHELLKEDVADMRAEIDALKAENRKER
jgi:hypothetical protein